MNNYKPIKMHNKIYIHITKIIKIEFLNIKYKNKNYKSIQIKIQIKMSLILNNILIKAIVGYLKKMDSENKRFAYILKNKNTIINTNINIDYFLNHNEIDEYSKGFLINIMNNEELLYFFGNKEYEKYNSDFVKFSISERLSGEIQDEFSKYSIAIARTQIA